MRSDKLKCWFCRTKPTELVFQEYLDQTLKDKILPKEKLKKILLCTTRPVMPSSSWGNHAVRTHLVKQKDTTEGEHWIWADTAKTNVGNVDIMKKFFGARYSANISKE